MRGLKLGVLGVVLTTSLVMASEKEDLKYLDEIFKQKRYDLAIEESKNFLNRYPETKYSKDIQLKLAKLYFLERDYENSRIYFLNVSQNFKNSKKENEEVNSYLARIYAALGNETMVDTYVSQIGENEKLIFEIGNSYLQGDNFARAAEYFQKTLQLQGKYYSEALLNMAVVKYNTAAYGETLKFLNSYQQSSGEKNVALMEYLYGFSHYKLGDSTKARQYFEAIISKYPGSNYAKKSSLALIEIYSNSEEITKAIELLVKLSGTQEEVEGIKIIGNYYISKKNYGRAIDYYEKVLHISDNDLYYNYGYALYSSGKFEKAIKAFEKLKSTKYEAKGKYYIAASQYKLKKYSNIFNERNSLRKLSLEKEQAESLEIMIANSAYELGDYEIAKSIYLDVYNKNITPENLYKITVLNSRLGEKEELLKRFNNYRALFPHDIAYRKQMYILTGDALHSLNKTEEEEKIYREFLTMQEDLDISDRYVTVLLNAQKYKELGEYLTLQQDNAQNRYLKGIAYMGMGQYDEAQLYFENLSIDENTPKDIAIKSRYNLVKNKFLKGEYQQSVELGEEYLRQGNSYNQEDIIDRIAIGYFRLDNFEKSREYFSKLKENKKYEDYGQFQIAETYYSEKKYDLAKNEYRKVYLQNSKGDYTEKARYWEMNACNQLGQFTELKKLSQEFMKLYPKSALKDNIFFILAEISKKTGKVEETLTIYKDLYTSSSQQAVQEDALTKIVEINESRNNLDEGLKWAENFKDDIKKSYYKAIILEKKGEYEKAFEEYKKLEKLPDYKDFVALGYGNYWHHKGDLNKSQKYYEELLDIPNSFYKDFAQYQLAEIKERQQKYDDAIRGYNKVYIMYPQSDLAEISQLRAGELNEKQGQEKKAIAIFEELFEKGQKNEYKTFLLEKIIYLSLKNKEEVKAKNYHTKLKKLDAKLAEKYNDYFKGGN
jgi:tetratricopeptide (TPR) repeat protein